MILQRIHWVNFVNKPFEMSMLTLCQKLEFLVLHPGPASVVQPKRTISIPNLPASPTLPVFSEEKKFVDQLALSGVSDLRSLPGLGQSAAHVSDLRSLPVVNDLRSLPGVSDLRSLPGVSGTISSSEFTLSGTDSSTEITPITEVRALSPVQDSSDVYLCFDTQNLADSKLVTDLKLDLLRYGISTSFSLKRNSIEEDTIEQEAKTIQNTGMVALLLSDSAVTSESVRDQVHYACESDKLIVIILLRDVVNLDDITLSAKGGALGMMLSNSTQINFYNQNYLAAFWNFLIFLFSVKRQKIRTDLGLANVPPPLVPFEVEEKDVQSSHKVTILSSGMPLTSPGFYKLHRTIIKQSPRRESHKEKVLSPSSRVPLSHKILVE